RRTMVYGVNWLAGSCFAQRGRVQRQIVIDELAEIGHGYGWRRMTLHNFWWNRCDIAAHRTSEILQCLASHLFLRPGRSFGEKTTISISSSRCMRLNRRLRLMRHLANRYESLSAPSSAQRG